MPASRQFTHQESEGYDEQVAWDDARARTAAEAVARRTSDAGSAVARAPAFTHLQTRSSYSLRDGAIRPRELAAAAAAAGMTHVALTDRDGLYGAVRFAKACLAEGVTPVYGTDLALAPEMERAGWGIARAGRARDAVSKGGAPVARGGASQQDPRVTRPRAGAAWLEDDAPRVTFIARTTAGWGDVARTVSAAHLNGAVPGAMRPGATVEARDMTSRSSPHLAWEDVARVVEHDGAVALLGVDSPVGRLLAEGREQDAATELKRWVELLGRGNVRLGVRNHMVAPGGRGQKAPVRGPGAEPGDDVRIARTLALSELSGVQAVASNDVRHLTRDDAFLADVLTCVRQQVPLGTRHLGRDTAEGWFTTAAEQARRFSERPDLMVAAHELAVSCEVDLGIGGLVVPRLTGMADEVAAGELHRRCWQGVADRFDRITPAVRERLERELAMVDRLQLHDYFLAIGDIVDGIRAMGVMAACRGSAAGSLVCYALRISDVDPIAHDLAFERFMNPYRDELPDVDVDVEAHRRPDVYDMVLAKYGEHRTACVAMVETFQAKMAVREVGKVLGLPPDEIGHIAKNLSWARARDVRGLVRSMPELKGSRMDAGQLDRLFDIVERIDGFPRHLALHPCGILLADRRLTDRTPLQRSAAGYPMSQFDKDDVAALGLLKLDVLAVRMLSSMGHALTLTEHTRGTTMSVDDIPQKDPATYELLRSTRSIGIFQIESPGQQELLGRLQPDHFGDLITEISLFRPGPVTADMVTPFVRRRHGEEATVYAHPALEPILRETHGVIVYHEQVMGALVALTGCDMSYADLLRRRLSDSDAVASIRAWALARAVDRGFTAEDAAEVWRQLSSFASFGFCKAHAAAFAVPTYRSAWMKTHLFPEFFAGLLTHDPGMYPKRLIVEECRTFGVAVLPPDINRSEPWATVEVVDRGLADHVLGLTGDHLPPGWTAGTRAGERPMPPSGFDQGDAGNGYRYAVRLGLDGIRGVAESEVASMVAGRPYTSLDEVRGRAGLSRPAAEQLTAVGAFDQVAGVARRGGPKDRRVLKLFVDERWRGTQSRRAVAKEAGVQQLGLDVHLDHEPQLPALTGAEQLRGELHASGIDVSRHVVSFYEPLLHELGVVRASDLSDLAPQTLVRIAGVKVALQSPQQRSGNRVLFLSLDDRTGTVQATFFHSTLQENAWTLMHGWMFVIEGRVSRRGATRDSARRGDGTTVVGQRAWDMSRLWRARSEGWLHDALAELGTPAPHEDRRSSRTAGAAAGLRAAEFGRGSA
jgi:error-prone DNA polymerase